MFLVKTCLSLGPKIPYLGVFGEKNGKHCHIRNLPPLNCKNVKFHAKQKSFMQNTGVTVNIYSLKK